MKILIAEDDFTNHLLFRAYFKRLNIDFEFAKNGKIALEKLEQDQFDVLFLDIYMPVMNGLEVLNQIKQNNMDENLHIVGLSAEEDLSKEFDYFLSKQIGLSRVLGTVDAIKKRK